MGFQITGVPEADAVLDEYPFALAHRDAARPAVPHRARVRGAAGRSPAVRLARPGRDRGADPDEFTALCRTPPAIHRFPGTKAAQVQELARLVVSRYDGDVTRIWTEARNGAELHKRLTELPGFGDQTAKILIALLAKQRECSRPAGGRRPATTP